MSPARLWALTGLAMLAFAGNSLLCRAALGARLIDPASFTAIRLASGALVLWLIVRARTPAATGRGNWVSAMALFVYAAGFSFAYSSLSASTGALLLFGAVQATMIGRGVAAGERLSRRQAAGLLLALGGLGGLLLPGAAAPPMYGALLMLAAGLAWGIYSLRGRGAGDPTQVTAGNFLLACVPAALLLVPGWPYLQASANGVVLAAASGALASGLGYAIWYSALPALSATQAATVQLSVPVFVALGGWLVLAEPLPMRVVLAAIAILGGIALVVLPRRG